MKLVNTISKILISELSDKLTKTLIAKFQSETNNASEETIRMYIKKFNDLKNSPNIKEKDITKYSWADLEDIVDNNFKHEVKVGKMDVSLPDSNLIYNKNNIRVYEASTRDACVKYGHGYSFCISSRSDENAYITYRLYDYFTPYFVFFDNKSFEKKKDGKFVDPEHLLVVMVSPNEITVSTAENLPELKPYDNMDEVIEDYPQLSEVKNILIPVPLKDRDNLERKIKAKHQTLINLELDSLEDSDSGFFQNKSIRTIKKFNEILNGKIKMYEFTTNTFDMLTLLLKKEMVKINDHKTFFMRLKHAISNKYDDETYNYPRQYVKNRTELENEIKKDVNYYFTDEQDILYYKKDFMNKYFLDSASIEHLPIKIIYDAVLKTAKVTDLTKDFLEFVKENPEVAGVLHKIEFYDRKLKSDLTKLNMGIYKDLYFAD